MKRLLVFATLAALAGCSSSNTVPTPVPTASPVGKPVKIAVPLGLPPLQIPQDNPPTTETIALGEKLFFSPLLSGDGKMSCASCHDPNTGFADKRRGSIGIKGKSGNRNAPPVQNAAYATTQFWDGRAASLEEQALGPIANPIEMAATLDDVEKTLNADPSMKKLFIEAFGGPATKMAIARALASYERTLLKANSPFDRYQFGGDKSALNESAKRGLEVFRDAKKGNCAVCHTIEKDHALFTDQKFHNLGAGMDAEGKLADQGRYDVTKREEDRGAFRTPTLRNIALTSPYMHDGSLNTLKEVVDFYVGGGNENPHRDKEIKPLSQLTKQERADLVAFMEALTGEPVK